MTKKNKILSYVEEKYETLPENTFSKFPNYYVLRHKTNNKWYGLIMNVPKMKLGLDGSEETEVIDLKMEPELIGAYLKRPGFLPAYHMNKENWISINLNSHVPIEEIKELLDASFQLTS